MQQRKRGGQPGNTNAVTHGRHSGATRERREREWEERRRREREWAAKMPKTDYAAICAAIAASKATKH